MPIRIIFLLLIFSFSVSLKINAQINPLDTMKVFAENSYANGDFNEAKDAYLQIYQAYKKLNLIDSTALYLGKLLRCKNKFYEQDVYSIAKDFLDKYEGKVKDKTYVFRIMVSIGSFYTNNEDPEAYLKYSKEIKNYYDKHSLHEPLYLSNYYKLLAYNYNVSGNADSSEFYSLKNIEHIKKHFDPNDVEFGYAYYNLANFYSNFSKIELADSFYSLALHNLELNLEPDHSNIAVLSYVYSSELISLGKFQEARDLCYKAISIFESKGMDLFKGYAYLSLSRVESAEENFSTYKLYLDKAFQIIDSLESFPSLSRTRVYDGYTGYYLDHEIDFDKALYFQRKSLKEKKAIYTEANPNLVQSYFNFANIYRKSESFDSAYYYIEKALSESRALNNYKSEEYINILYEKGNIEYKRNNFKNAISLYKNAIKNYLVKYDSTHRYILEGYASLYNCYDYLEMSDSKNFYLKKATQDFFNNKNDKSLVLTPGILEACFYRIKKEFEVAESEEDYRRTFNNIEALNLTKILNQSMITDKSDVRAINTTIDSVYTIGIKNAIIAYQSFQQKSWLDLALKYDRINKARSIQSKIKEDNLLELSGLPSEAIEEYKKLRTEARYLEISSSSNEQDQHINLQKRKIDQKRNLANWNSKYSSQFLNNDLERGQNQVQTDIYKRISCKESTVFLSYNIIDSFYYCLRFGCDEPDFIKLGKVNIINEKIANYRLSLKNNQFDQIKKLGFELYKYIIEPLEVSNYKKFYVIPTGELISINFEIFIMNDRPQKNFKEIDWLIKSHEITYGINLPNIKSSLEKDNRSGMLILAPGFQDELKEAENLSVKKVSSTPWTIELANKLAKQKNSKLLSGNEATIEDWNKHKSNKQIIHIGTHATIDVDNPLNSTLLLNSDGSGIRFFDIYTSNLNTDLVVLAGCETGLGQMVESKELLSISHAFQYAGNEQLIQSMWKIDDESTNTILEEFYNQYNSSQNVGQSLRLAKLKYFEESSENFSSPYYWGGLIYLGNDINDFQSFDLFSLKNVFLIFLGLIAILIYIFRSRNVSLEK